jgi:hypothetical protein
MPTKVPVTPPAAPHRKELAGLVERVTSHSDESGFCVLRVKAGGHRNLVTVVGTLPEVRASEWLEAQGLLSYLILMSSGESVEASIARIVWRTHLAFMSISFGGKSFSSFSK